MRRASFTNTSSQVKRILILFTTLFFTLSCSEDSTQQSEILITTKNKWQGSTLSGNLITTAMRQHLDLDMVFYPTAFLSEEKVGVIKLGMSDSEIESIAKIYPNDVNDQFLVGTLKGKDIKRFLFLQSESTYRAELQVAGVRYDFKFVGGQNTVGSISRKNRAVLVDDHVYRVAISNTFFFSGKTAPGYLFGYGFNFTFKRFQEGFISAKDTLRQYLKGMTELPLIEAPRARVSTFNYGPAGTKNTYDIQSAKHISPYRGYKITTKGVITVVGYTDRYPGGYEIYIQDTDGDGNPVTSDGLFVYLKDLPPELKTKKVPLGESILKPGQLIEVTGTVYEDRFNSGGKIQDGLTRTSIRDLSSFKIIAEDQPMPEAIVLGQNGREVPNHYISTYNANLNQKPFLNMNDGIDFWESLESMQIKIHNPKVVGFSGGQDKFQDKGPKSYLNLYLKPDGDIADPSDTPAGGAIINESTNDYNPNLVSLWTHHLAKGLNIKAIFNVGDQLEGTIEGLLAYEKSFFNGGHYAFILPEKQDSLKAHRLKKMAEARARRKSDDKRPIKPEEMITPQIERPKTTILPTDDQLTVATYNIENLSTRDKARLEKMAATVNTNLGCPDILTLVEIQDFNGISQTGGSDATKTLDMFIENIPLNTPEEVAAIGNNVDELINNINIDTAEEFEKTIKSQTKDYKIAQACLESKVEYKHININPRPNSEGGQPGGNIRVSMIYNSKRVDFSPNFNNDPLAEISINSKTGALSHNPGRVFPNDSAFEGSRRSLIAEFKFKGERVLVIGNHFNSKLGDASLWGATQPPVLRSIRKRTKMADRINDFVEALVKADKKVNVIVAGDFNAHLTERAMKSLEGVDLKNLILFDHLVAPNDRYTTNHNGNSQGLDYILANKRLLKKNPLIEILHINSDYMHKLSDHDPLVSGFTFK